MATGSRSEASLNDIVKLADPQNSEIATKISTCLLYTPGYSKILVATVTGSLMDN